MAAYLLLLPASLFLLLADFIIQRLWLKTSYSWLVLFVIFIYLNNGMSLWKTVGIMITFLDVFSQKNKWHHRIKEQIAKGRNIV